MTTANNDRPPKKRGLRLAGLCIDWRAIAVLAIAAVGLLLWRPGLVLRMVPWMLVALCPLSMLFMMRSMGGMNDGGEKIATQEEIARLRERVEEMETQNRKDLELK